MSPLNPQYRRAASPEPVAAACNRRRRGSAFRFNMARIADNLNKQELRIGHREFVIGYWKTGSGLPALPSAFDALRRSAD